jgi:bifunctional UDP-N-acetylglucosamine pyrophosphorylase/glucosamine-1-phosphate N-acetyltransferase
VAAIVEDSALSDDQRAIREINSSIYCFTLAKLWPCLESLRPQNVHKELYLTDAIALLRQKGENVQAVLAADPDEVLGCNTRADLAAVDAVFRRRKRAAVMDAGVTMEMPESVLIDPEVTVGADTRIEPCVQLLGKTRVGAGCTIRTGSVLADAVLEDNVLVKPYSMVTSSHLSRGTQVGPFAHLRDGARLAENARVGNFVEVKKSVLGEGVKSMHLTYLGDARIGSGTNIGAGTITCNYDGVRKNPTTIGKRVFIGSNTALVAPVRVGDGAYVAAGSVITENVPADALGVARGRQVNKPGWAAARRRELAAAAKPAKSRPRKKSKRRATVRVARGGKPRKPSRRR